MPHRRDAEQDLNIKFANAFDALDGFGNGCFNFFRRKQSLFEEFTRNFMAIGNQLLFGQKFIDERSSVGDDHKSTISQKCISQLDFMVYFVQR